MKWIYYYYYTRSSNVILGRMENSNENDTQILLTDIQVEKVLICFMRETFNNDLKLINQSGWEKFEVLRISARARLKWGIDMCIQILNNANLRNKNRFKQLDAKNSEIKGEYRGTCSVLEIL